MTVEFSRVLEALSTDGDAHSVELTEDWSQGRSIFGGLQAAVGLAAMRRRVAPELALRALQTTFVAPIAPGWVTIDARVLRAGRNVVHVEGRLRQGGETACLVVGVFGKSRPSVVRRDLARPDVSDEAAFVAPFFPGLSPNFIQHFETRWLKGGMPFTGSKEPRIVVELGVRDRGAATEALMVAFADVIPPIALSMLETRAAGSSVAWLFEMLNPDVAGLPLHGYRFDAELESARDGYTTQSGVLFGPDGTAIAQSRQSMVVFG
jgi:acyl-CoA thioesterase